MEITFAPRGILQIDNARITHKNFAGEASPYNREGDRNFSLIIDSQEIADRLIEDGWNVKIRPARDVDEDDFMYLPVKVKFNGRGPNIRLQSGNNKELLNEETVAILDDAYLINCSMDIRPYDWEVSGKTGRTAYLHAMLAVQELDRFAE